MDKRFVNFLLASIAVIFAFQLITPVIFPELAQRRNRVENEIVEPGEAEDPADVPADAADEPQSSEDGQDAAPPPEGPAEPDGAVVAVPDVPKEIPEQRYTIGSEGPDSPYRMGVTFTNRGAAMERVALNSPRYRDLDKSGYLGYLALANADDGRPGCRVRVVIPGTPAAEAMPKSESVELGPGLREPTYTRDEDNNIQLESPGDFITALDGDPVSDVAEFRRRMAKTRPGQVIALTVQRQVNEATATYEFSATLRRRPLEVLRPEAKNVGSAAEDHPSSFLFTLCQSDDETKSLSLLHDGNWEGERLDDPDGPGIEFRRVLSSDELKAIGLTGPIEVVKRFRLATAPEAERDNPAYPAYHLTYDLEIRNLGAQKEQIVYQQDGPTGLVLEGWWYSYKSRDVAWRTDKDKVEIFNVGKIVKNAEKAKDDLEGGETPLFSADGAQLPLMKYVGCDAQYFAAVLLPCREDPAGQSVIDAGDYRFAKAVALPAGELDQLNARKRTDVTFRLTSPSTAIPPDGLFRRYEIFVGPKQADILAQYGLEDMIVYGWFGAVSRPMVAILHFFYGLVRNYGLAIIMLTILVRGCMYPLGRKMARNAQKMQELAPEMKQIMEKYKKDMQKRADAQRELWRKHNCNPLGGCWVMLLQLPIFIGLYRGLSVDIELRQAPLIPGLSWCSNLAAPDAFLYWENLLPIAFLTGQNGFLGPYLNLLPLATCALMVVHQKLFTPPATDEQQQMQQQVMKFMMLFMAVLFFKIASGLCIYFIASSMWGLAERILLPKPKSSNEGQPAAKQVLETSGAGASRSPAKVRQKKRPKRR